jgi:putative phosphoesterase
MEEPTFYGPSGWEGPPLRHGPVARAAVLSDVHGNVPALEAVLAEPDVAAADVVLFTGDMTWGPEPQRTYELIAGLGGRALRVRGNADRYAAEIAAAVREPSMARESWIPARHSAEAVAFLARTPFSLVLEVEGLGEVFVCHGSPRSDHELVTPGTPDERFAELAAGVEPRILVGGHTHLQFDRTVAGRRSVNPGSVGLPFHNGEPGTAYWALLGPDVELRRTPYDLEAAVELLRAGGMPSFERIEELMRTPPPHAEVIEHAERVVFAG